MLHLKRVAIQSSHTLVMIVRLTLNINFWTSPSSSSGWHLRRAGTEVEIEKVFRQTSPHTTRAVVRIPVYACVWQLYLVCILTSDNWSYYQAISLHSGTKSSPLANNEYTYCTAWGGKCEKFSTSSHAHRMWPCWVKTDEQTSIDSLFGLLMWLFDENSRIIQTRLVFGCSLNRLKADI